MENINEKQRLEKVYKKTVSGLKKSLNLFNPENYTSEILRGSKDVWINTIKDALLAADEASIDLDDLRSEDEKKEAVAAMKVLETDVTKFIFNINVKALGAQDASDEAKKEAKISFDMDFQKLLDGIDLNPCPRSSTSLMIGAKLLLMKLRPLLGRFLNGKGKSMKS